MTSHAKTAPPTVAQNGGRLGPSREELAELERELDVYLTFWAHAQDRSIGIQGSCNGERA
jgi:hypothetical protein